MPYHLTPRAARGAQMSGSRFGFQLSALQGRDQAKHPWQVTPFFSPLANRWAALIKPGFVNQKCPVRRTSAQEQARYGLDFETHPLTEKAWPGVHAASDDIDVPLYFAPAIGLVWTPLGLDGDPSQPVPQYFLDRGAAQHALFGKDLSNPDAIDLEGLTQTGPENARLLRRCDLWLHQPRHALSSEVTIEPGLITGDVTLRQTLSLAQPDASDTLRVSVGTFSDPSATPRLEDALFSENPWDERLIATLYLLSPPGLEPGSEPDATWQPYVEHALFWNLQYHTPQFAPVLPAPPLVVFVPLLGFTMQWLINTTTSAINEGFQRAQNLIFAHSLQGTFWTATGGGSDAELPSTPLPIAGPINGLDKTARLRAEALAAARAPYEALNPPFPYRAVPFDPDLLRRG